MTDPGDPLGIKGTLIGEKYLVGDLVGEGGFAVVYKAEHTIWKQPVALKCFRILSSAPESQRQQLLDGFVQEGKLMTELSSRSAAVVQARDVGTFTTPDGVWVPYMVLEWLEGQPLDVVLEMEAENRTPPRTLDEAMLLLDPAAKALALVHERGIAHRDIKPANLFVIGDARSANATVKVLDFGIAKVMSEQLEQSAATAKTGGLVTAFTPQYGAPEQFSRSHGATGPWTDVFAMALILVELLTGGSPMPGEDYLDLANISRDPAKRPTPRTMGVSVSDAVEAVFQRALAVAPTQRYATVGQFWADLRDAANSGLPSWTAMPPSRGSMTPPISLARTDIAGGYSGVPTMTQQASATTAPAPKASRAPLLAGIAAVVLVGVGASLALLYQPGGEVTPAGQPTASAAATQAPVIPASASASATKRTTCPDDMALVPGGRFFMGSDDDGFKLWQPAHRVSLNPFCIDLTEVTVAAYRACSDRGDCKRPTEKASYPKTPKSSDADHARSEAAYTKLCNFGKEGRDKHPINCVTWQMAHDYCAVAKKRLPTEAEWEYAARGSDGRKFPWGEEVDEMERMNAGGTEFNAWEKAEGLPLSARMYDMDDGYAGTAPVGSFPRGKTQLGAFDMVGNVWEWTDDWFAVYTAEEQVQPHGAVAGDRKAIRGGGFNGGYPTWVNPAFRYWQVPNASTPAIGFRCAATL